jgi:hypothetical protein
MVARNRASSGIGFTTQKKKGVLTKAIKRSSHRIFNSRVLFLPLHREEVVGNAWFRFRKQEKGLLNDVSGCQPRGIAFVKTPFFLCPLQWLKWGPCKTKSCDVCLGREKPVQFFGTLVKGGFQPGLE